VPDSSYIVFEKIYIVTRVSLELKNGEFKLLYVWGMSYGIFREICRKIHERVLKMDPHPKKVLVLDNPVMGLNLSQQIEKKPLLGGNLYKSPDRGIIFLTQNFLNTFLFAFFNTNFF